MHKYKCTVCILAVIHGILTVVTAYHLNRQIRKVNISQNCTTDTAAINISQPKPPSVSVNPDKNKALCKTKLWICWNTSIKVKVKTNVSSSLISLSLHCRLIFHKVVILKYMKSKWCIPVDLRCIYMISLMQECL